MMQTIKYPKRDEWVKILKRPMDNNNDIKEQVSVILKDVKAYGDAAVKKYTQQFDMILPANIEVSREEWMVANSIDNSLKDAINTAIKNISCFHQAQIRSTEKVETMPGVVCWQKSVGIEKVGLYIPGGTAPLFSTLLMLAIPARLAGCSEIIVCSPPDKTGTINPAILYAAKQSGIKRLFKIGGAQAIAAMAYGTETIPLVYKIFGPGNRYVTCAKTLLSAESVAIDMPAGPSELAVLADDTCLPEFVAADLLSQAEHGPDSQVLLVSADEVIIDSVKNCLEEQLQSLPRKEIATKALGNSKVILVNNMTEGIALINDYAPEHLIIACNDNESIAESIVNCGSVFLGNYSPESAGDYASGTNHTLPTNGFAKAYSGISVDSFLKKMTFQKISHEGLLKLAPTIETMAIAEGLDAHAKAVTIRTKIKNDEDI